MPTQVWTGAGGNTTTGWSPGSVASDDNLVIDDVAVAASTGLAGLTAVDAQSLKWTSRARADFGTPEEPFVISVNQISTGLVVNDGKSRLIHLKGGTAASGIIYRVVHNGPGRMILTDCSGLAVEAVQGQMVVGGGSTYGTVEAAGTAYVDVRRGAEQDIGGLNAGGRAQVDLARDIATKMRIYDDAVVRATFDDMDIAGLEMTGGRFVPRGGGLDDPDLRGGVLDLSELVADLAVTNGGTWGQDLVIIPSPLGARLTISGTPSFIGRPPAGLPVNWA